MDNLVSRLFALSYLYRVKIGGWIGARDDREEFLGRSRGDEVDRPGVDRQFCSLLSRSLIEIIFRGSKSRAQRVTATLISASFLFKSEIPIQPMFVSYSPSLFKIDIMNIRLYKQRLKLITSFCYVMRKRETNRPRIKKAGFAANLQEIP